MFVKIKNNFVLLFPYTFENLQNENPYTNFGDTQDLKALYEKTENAEKNNSSLELVVVEDRPSIDDATQNCVLSNLPLFKNNNWVLEYSIIDKTQKEIDKYKQDKLDGTIA